MLDERARALIRRELAHLDRLIQDYANVLSASADDEPDLLTRTALSAIVQSFYQGIEAIFQTVAKRVDGRVPAGPDWHRALLGQMSTASDHRPSLISPALLSRLEPFLGFRHLARHTYPFMLDWQRMCHLVREVVPVHRELQKELSAYLGVADPPAEDSV